MARFCKICQRPPREGDPMHLIRLYPGDEPDFPYPVHPESGNPLPVGLPACAECVERHKPRAAARLGKPVEELSLWDLL